MIPVTAWARKVKQPRGGYLPVKSMYAERFDDGRTMNPVENLNPGTVGTAVDYISRVMAGGDVRDVFRLPIAGAEKLGRKVMADRYVSEIMIFADGLEPGDDLRDLITAGLNLSRFDVAFKASDARYLGALNGEVAIDDATMENMQTMLRRIAAFRDRNGLLDARPRYMRYKTFPGLTGEDCLSGEADIVSGSSLWDCKAMTAKLRATYTAQLLAYYVMLFHEQGLDAVACVRSGRFNPFSDGPGDFTLGFFNPRENTEYRTTASGIPTDTFAAFESALVDIAYMY